jgi:cytochrome P450
MTQSRAARSPLGSKTPARIPGHFGLGNLLQLLADPLSFLTRAVAAHRDELVLLKLGPVDVYLASHPTHIEHILSTNWRSYTKSGAMWNPIRRLVGMGLVTSDGELWQRHRRMIQPLFTHKSVERYLELMTSAAIEAIDELQVQPDRPIDMSRFMLHCTQRILLKSVFSEAIDGSTVDRLGDALTDALTALNLRIFLYFLPSWLPIPGERSFRQALATLDSVIFKYIRQRRTQSSGGPDVLSLLLSARDEQTNRGLTEQQLRDEVTTLFVAGNETTAITMSWLWFELCKNPEAEKKMRAEIAQVVGNRLPTWADLNNLHYNKLAIQEILRLYPPAWFIPRIAMQDDNLCGYIIPKGSAFLLCPYLTQRDPAWWPNPDRFEPERFADGNSTRPRYSYYPFGGGPRQCLGNLYGVTESQLLSVLMMQRYRFRLDRTHPVLPSSATTLRPAGGLKMFLERL